MRSVEDRLHRLERTNRWLWWALLVALAAPVLTEFIGRQAIGVEPKRKTVEERVEVLEARTDKALEDAVQAMILVMARSELECRGIAVMDEKRKPRILISGGEKNGSASVSMTDQSGKPRLELIVSADGSAIIRNWDSKGKIRLGTGLMPDGTPTFLYHDSKGRPVNLLEAK